MNGQRHVGTRAIQAAVKGRETEVLDALGVPWREARPHIACPYPQHADSDPSWRWDGKPAKARCTCGTGSIFDVIMKIEGVDFAAAKLRAAEILGLNELIEESNGAPRFQATDAASLLAASPDQRDDRLPLAYLAHRLGVDAEAVPPPTTPYVGLKALAYFDAPPPGSKAKPKAIGNFPCAVFGTLSADGRRHGHRIYVAPAGAGKADLGMSSNGRPRDPKKSAKVVGEQSTAGCAVLWGEPSQAPHLLLAEGIETAAAVALAVLPEIHEGRVAVAAAISAVGMESFLPWSATQRVTIAADRDEAAKPDGRPGSRRGEQAARAFALQHHPRVEIAIALPGSTGESLDWLDVLLRDGSEAVRDGLLTAAPFVPTPDEREAAADSRQRQSQLEQMGQMYPLPAMDTVQLIYAFTKAGPIKVHKLIDYELNPETGRKEPIWLPVASPFGVTARLRLLEQGQAFGIRVVVQDMHGEPCAVDFDRADLARMGAAEIRSRLFAAGLRTEGDGEIVVVQALKAADPAVEIKILSRAGWHQLPELPLPVFMTPTGQALGQGSSSEIGLAATVQLAAPTTAGSLREWRQAVAAAIAAPGCPHWTLGAAAAFAGSLIDLTGLDSCGINLSGLSTSGKTTAQRIAVSAWSSPAPGAGLLQSMRTTENALEALSQLSSGTLLALDELAHADGRALARMIYSLAGGVGKARMTAGATLRRRSVWRTFILLSGECSLEEKIRADGGVWTAGMAARIADVDVTGVDRQVERAILDRLDGIRSSFGHAGPAFIEGLIGQGLHQTPEVLRERILKAAATLATPGADSAYARAALAFASIFVAGQLAVLFHLLPDTTPLADSIRWGWERFTQSSDAAALSPEDQALNNLCTWLAERWDVTVRDVAAGADVVGGKRVNNRESVAWYDAQAVYLPTHRLREATGSTLKELYLARMLAGRDLLHRTDKERLAVRYVPRIGHLQCYALRRSAFGRTNSEAPPFAVFEGGRR